MSEINTKDRKEYQKQYRLKHSQKHKDYCKAYHKKRYPTDEEYRNRIKAQSASWISKHKHKRPSIYRKWRLNNLKKCAEHAARRRARERGNCVDILGINQFVERVRSLWVVTCYYCKTPLSPKKAHIDHVEPVCNGGRHAVDNLCVSCPRCNLTKREKTLDQWPKSGQRFLRL